MFHAAHENTTTPGPTTRVVSTVALVEPTRLLVIEDDIRIGSSLARALEGSGYLAIWAPTAKEGTDAFMQALAEEAPFRLVLLDLGLPDADGLDVCRSLVNADPQIPVVMLTARDGEIDLVIGLDAGAIDYVTKPFSLAPLLARIRAQLRRTEHSASIDQRLTGLTIGALTISQTARRITQDGKALS
jgi:DNA-binding response OmpR family regulator